MNGETSPSFLTRILSITFFSILTASSLAWFFISTFNLLSQLNDPVIEFDKGAMYMLGVGIGLLCLTAGGFIEGIFGKNLTSTMESLFKYGLIASIVVMVAIPHLAHYLMNNYVQKRHYEICNEAGYRWLLYSKYYYTENESVCSELVKEKQRK